MSAKTHGLVSFLNAGGHEGSFSLMSLFVFFQSAASSDGGEYKSFFLSFKTLKKNQENDKKQTFVSCFLKFSVKKKQKKLPLGFFPFLCSFSHSILKPVKWSGKTSFFE